MKAYFDSKAINYGNTFWANLLKSYESKQLLKLLPLNLGSRILDLGCGQATFSQHLLKIHPSLEIHAVDCSEKMLGKILNKKITLNCNYLEDYNSRLKYDLILALGVLEFLNNPHQLFEKAASLGSTNSKLLILYPPRNLFAVPYKAFHQNHGINIKLFKNHEILKMAHNHGWHLGTRKTIHPYAIACLFEK